MKKTLGLVLSMILIGCMVVAGTLAWFTDQTEVVKNTFAIGNINIDLKEHDYIPADQTLNFGSEVIANDDYHFVPGDILPKDPFVRVAANSEACFLFVHVAALNNAQTVNDVTADPIILYEVDEKKVGNEGGVWTAVNGYQGYYYLEVSAQEAKTGKIWNVLKDNRVRISTDVIKEMVTAINKNEPVITITAAAIQSANLPIDPNREQYLVAWDNLPAEFKPDPSVTP